ncbi:hypothetical protein ACRAWC_01005 [Leifsonia sp. L25]|uniref:hypothetical protein n=1 Tax=Actinomycetes TaxID=1760 RepID=UPI003D68B4CB
MLLLSMMNTRISLTSLLDQFLLPFRRLIKSEWTARSAGTVEYRTGAKRKEDMPRKSGAEHRERATIGRRKDNKPGQRSAARSSPDQRYSSDPFHGGRDSYRTSQPHALRASSARLIVQK